MRTTSPHVIVVGSLNVDYIASVAKLPLPGETIAASNLIKRFGGKGANQAVAAARQGVKVSMVGCVGTDDEGRAYANRLKQEGIKVRGITRTDRALTGTALIAVDDKAENIIIVAPGANGHLSPQKIKAAERILANASALLLQFEIPMETTQSVVRWANRARVPVVLNPSPLREGFAWGKAKLQTLIVNAGEAQSIFGLPLERIPERLPAWRQALHECQVTQLIVTRGAQSTICITGTEYHEVPVLKVEPVDTVGAGDAFAGTFVARRAEGLDLLASVRLANCAGALATLKAGAQEAIPGRAATQRALRTLPS